MHSNNAASGDEPVPLQEIDHYRNGLFWLIERLTMGGIMHVGHLDVRTNVMNHSGGRLCSLGPEVCMYFSWKSCASWCAGTYNSLRVGPPST